MILRFANHPTARNINSERSILTLATAAVAVLGAVAKLAPSAAAQETADPMRGVFAVIYERGPAYDDSKDITEQVSIEDHIAYGQTIKDKFLAGGLLGTLTDDNVLGMVVFEAENIEAAEQWVSHDPGVENGVLTAKVRQWQVSSIRAYQGK
ncbi:hypothetical protein ASE04_18325 [Rhizobium sp. Root708]|uniref:YciI family protein n=1 Tax=Rhizobium sp. Root708 TaxID=1736592 RepID=UPI0006FA3E98|nr:YciI family protein [Rhizobium sp. Root708]KRB49138.1 hypothetical protein ASE04_18325 [Rhizobium sp. Root708]